LNLEAQPPDTTTAEQQLASNQILVFVKTAECLRTKNNLSSLGMDGIGHLFMNLGEVPMIKFLPRVFTEYIRNRDVSDT
jgi:hypothetical protein